MKNSLAILRIVSSDEPTLKNIIKQQLQHAKLGIPIRIGNLRMNKKAEINLYCCSSLHIQIVLTGMQELIECVFLGFSTDRHPIFLSWIDLP